VGTGFHPELTGFENIYLNGTILGMTKAEIDTHIEEIIEFAGIPHHIHSPVKRYSSGMKVWLGFAVAAHLNPEILIIDEVLAVGDAEFQAKCLGKIKEVTENNRTVLFVSHNMAAIRRLCTSAIFLKEGKIDAQGDTRKMIDRYLTMADSEEKSVGQVKWDSGSAPGNEAVNLLAVRTTIVSGEVRDTFITSEPVVIEITYKVHTKIDGARMIIQLKDSFDNIAFTSTDHLVNPEPKSPGTYVAKCIIPENLLNAERYAVVIHMGIPGIKVLINNVHALNFDTILMGNNGSIFNEKWPGIVAPLLKWQTQRQD